MTKSTTYLKLIDTGYESQPLKMKDYLDLLRGAESSNLFAFLKKFILKTTTLNEEQINKLLLSDAIACAIAWSVENLSTLSLDENDSIFMSDLIRTDDEVYTGHKCTIGGYAFDIDNITLDRAIKAEGICYSKGDSDSLGLYLLASACGKGINEGIKALVNSDFSEELLMDIRLMAQSVSKNGLVSLMLGIESRKIMLKVTGKELTIPIDSSFFLPS